jgi:hypothetical protein
VDEIYLEKDPIEASLKIRRHRGGTIDTVIPNKNLAFFFTLKAKKPEIHTNLVTTRTRVSHLQKSAKNKREQRTAIREKTKDIAAEAEI